MRKNEPNCRSHCPINYALEIFGDSWTLLIIRDLMFKGKNYYGDFLTSNEKMSTNILADRLKKLELHGLVTKSVDEANRSKVLYSLTEKGRDLLPIMMDITAWSGKYDKKTNAPNLLLEKLKQNRDGVIEHIRAGWSTKKS